MPCVSIITPAWNAEGFIAETIRSVQAQSFTDWELIIADDGSSDNTTGVVGRFAAEDPRICLVQTGGRKGPALARQAAIDRASGRYLAFLDSDDLWLPDKLSRQLAFMSERGAALSYTGYRRMSEDGRTVGALRPVPARLAYHDILKNTAIGMLTAMVDRQIAGPVAMKNEPYDDYCLWLTILKRGHIAHGLPEDLARYRVRGGSVSSRPLRSASWVWHIFRKVEGLSLLRSVWCLVHFGVRAALKRAEF